MFRRSVLSQWRIYRSGTVMRITCSAQGKQLLGFLGRDRVMLACLPIEQSCPATHCPRHTAQMSGRGLAAGGILSVTAGHPPHAMYILGEIQLSSSFKCPMGVMPKPYIPYKPVHPPFFSSLFCSCPPTFHPFLLCFHFQNIC